VIKLCAPAATPSPTPLSPSVTGLYASGRARSRTSLMMSALRCSCRVRWFSQSVSQLATCVKTDVSSGIMSESARAHALSGQTTATAPRAGGLHARMGSMLRLSLSTL
jgi:hypothetical protein